MSVTRVQFASAKVHVRVRKYTYVVNTLFCINTYMAACVTVRSWSARIPRKANEIVVEWLESKDCGKRHWVNVKHTSLESLRRLLMEAKLWSNWFRDAIERKYYICLNGALRKRRDQQREKRWHSRDRRGMLVFKNKKIVHVAIYV